eukprot:EG_transcript_64942
MEEGTPGPPAEGSAAAGGPQGGVPAEEAERTERKEKGKEKEKERKRKRPQPLVPSGVEDVRRFVEGWRDLDVGCLVIDEDLTKGQIRPVRQAAVEEKYNA